MINLYDETQIKWEDKVFIRYFDTFIYIYNLKYKREIIVNIEIECLIKAFNHNFRSIKKMREELIEKYSSYNNIKESFIKLCGLLIEQGFLTSDAINKNDSMDEVAENLNKNSSQKYLRDYFVKNPTIWSASIELLTDCNLNCMHCYNSNQNTYIPKEIIFKLLDNLKEMKTHSIILTGGEPLMHPDFFEILTECSERGFVIDIFTNGFCINDKHIKAFLELNVRRVQISLLSTEPEVHDYITQKSGSHAKTVSSIKRLLDEKIKVSISCPVIKSNLSSISEMINWSKENNVKVKFDLDMMPKSDRSCTNLGNRLSRDEYIMAKSFLKDDVNQSMTLDNEKFDLSRKSCLAGFSSITIGANGDIYPCPTWKSYIIGNVYNDNLDELWKNSEKLNFIRGLSIESFPKCKSCKWVNKCRICFSNNFNLTGDMLYMDEKFCLTD